MTYRVVIEYFGYLRNKYRVSETITSQLLPIIR